MIEEEKWEEEAKKEFKPWWENYYSKHDRWKRHPASVVLEGFVEGYLAACRKRQEEMEKLKGYKILFEDLKDRVIRDGKKGFTQKTARAWLLVQKYEEAK